MHGSCFSMCGLALEEVESRSATQHASVAGGGLCSWSQIVPTLRSAILSEPHLGPALTRRPRACLSVRTPWEPMYASICGKATAIPTSSSKCGAGSSPSGKISYGGRFSEAGLSKKEVKAVEKLYRRKLRGQIVVWRSEIAYLLARGGKNSQ